jgi:amidase
VNYAQPSHPFFPENPSQSVLGSASKDNMSHDKYLHDLEYLRRSFRDAIEQCFKATGADVIMASGESYLTSVASGAGYPTASVPLGFSSYNGRPHGMEIMARNGEEGKMFEFMSAWEALPPEYIWKCLKCIYEGLEIHLERRKAILS